jgi:hypothetical protein
LKSLTLLLRKQSTFEQVPAGNLKHQDGAKEAALGTQNAYIRERTRAHTSDECHPGVRLSNAFFQKGPLLKSKSHAFCMDMMQSCQ